MVAERAWRSVSARAMLRAAGRVLLASIVVLGAFGCAERRQAGPVPLREQVERSRAYPRPGPASEPSGVPQAYPGPARLADQLARLTCGETEFGYSLAVIRKLDGVPVPAARDSFGPREVDMLPGEHVVELGYVGFGVTNALVGFTAEPGGRYEARAARLRAGFLSELGRGLLGAVWPLPLKGWWVAWVVDARSGTVVGGKEPRQSLFTTAVDP